MVQYIMVGPRRCNARWGQIAISSANFMLWSRQGAIEIHVYLSYFTFRPTTSMMKRDNGGIFRRITRRKQCDNFRRLYFTIALDWWHRYQRGAKARALSPSSLRIYFFLNYHALELFIKISWSATRSSSTVIGARRTWSLLRAINWQPIICFSFRVVKPVYNIGLWSATYCNQACLTARFRATSPRMRSLC